jgi:hypothetical protein
VTRTLVLPQDVTRYQNGIVNVNGFEFFGVASGAVEEPEHTEYLHGMYCIGAADDGCWYPFIKALRQI